MAGYTRQSAASIVANAVIEDSHFNNEFNQLEAAFSGSTGHAHDGSTGNGPKISLTTSVTGILPVANGGTGVTSLQDLNNALTGSTVFKDSDFVIGDNSDLTKRFRFEVSGVTTATTRVFTLPDTNVTLHSYMAGLLNTSSKANLQTALDINPTATTNSSDAHLLDRANHTGSQAISTITNLQTSLDAKVAGPASSTADRIAVFDGTTGKLLKVGGSTIANVLDRSNHTGSQAISTITNLQTTLTSLADDIDDLADDITALQSGKFDKPTGSTSQYIRGDGSLATMPASAVLSVAGKTGAVTLDTNDISGLGNSATRNVGTTSGTVAAGDDSRITGAVQSSGDTMTGALTLSGNPTNNLHAATKQYVDNAVASVPIPVGLYTGSTSDETNLPVGHHVLLEGSVARNASSPVSLSAGSSYSSSASGSQLSGTWRARGRISLGGSNYGTLMQRTA